MRCYGSPVAEQLATTTQKPQTVYNWSGKNRQGQKVSGEMEAQGPAFVRSKLRREGINARTIRKKPKPLFGKKIKPKDISIASRQVATMLGAGIPIALATRPVAARV